MDNETSKLKKLSDGRYMHGVYAQYIGDLNSDGEISSAGFMILEKISRETFGWRLEYGYIKQDKFSCKMSKSILLRERKILVEKGFISFKTTKSMSMYKINLPKEITDEFEFNFLKNPKKYLTKAILKSMETNKCSIDSVLVHLKKDIKSHPMFDDALSILRMDIEAEKNMKKTNIEANLNKF